jgi:hypothetical protein
MTRWAVLVLVQACGTLTGPSAWVAKLGIEDEAERRCVLATCDDADSLEAFSACRTQRCSHQPETWTLRPTAVRHAGETVFLEAALGYAPAKYGYIEAQRPRQAYVGVTVVTSTGEEIDLAVTTVFADQLGESFTLSSDVGPDVRDVIFGVWDRKIEPCDSERSGCKEFGFLLDGPLATWPPTVYTDGVRQRIPPASVDVVVLDAGAGSKLPARRAAVIDALSTELAVFGSSVGTVHTRRADRASPGSHLLLADDHDLLLAREAAARMEFEVAAIPDPKAVAPIVLKLGGGAFEASAICAAHQDAAYDDCILDIP